MTGVQTCALPILIVQVRDPIERDQYIKAMARRLDVSEAALRQARAAAAQHPRVPPTGDGAPIRRAAPITQPLSVERELLQLVLARPELLSAAVARVSSEDFLDPELRGVYERLVEHESDIARGVNPLTIFSDDPLVAELTRLSLASPPLSYDEDERRLALIADRFGRARLERRLSDVDGQINRLITSGRVVPEPLREEYNALAASLRGLRNEGDRKEG